MYSYLYADLYIVFNSFFLSLNSLCILFYFRERRAAALLFVFLSIGRFRHRFKCAISKPQFGLYSFLFATRESFKNAIFLRRNSHCFSIYLQIQISNEMRYLSPFIRLVFFFICNVNELLKRVISLPQFSLYFYPIAHSDIFLNALSLSLNLHCNLVYLQNMRASKTRKLSAAILIVFLYICRFIYCFKCVISQAQSAVYSFLFAT